MKIWIKRIIRRIRYFPKFVREARTWEYESCKDCGSVFRVMWTVDDDIWQDVMEICDDGGGSLCVSCFVKRAEKKNVIIKPEQIRLNIFYPDEDQ